MSAGKKIKISSFLDIQAESLHEKITDHSAGKTQEVTKQEPHQTTKSVTVTSNPVKYETKGASDEPKVTEGKEKTIQQTVATVGYDTSQL
ncbi:hypothetical protein LTR78_008012 [Recurvomyces mirabilis]|uniref:Uncharacterized protein n=1 Tax=Recurvomyces mirabilis TaxID=574656 RepID=A0AAE0TRM2_9PEZI|nr:hypothetical protein LTR78_008012 [Recurvomyces mirabilis]KAK5150739.1 hypothetical protein LTS14_009802 [Recurvomyces mirabilis]